MHCTAKLTAALNIIARLQAEGHQAYLAGGCVRDLLLGREPNDYDVATSATPDVVLPMFARSYAVGAHFGVVLVEDTSAAAKGIPAHTTMDPDSLPVEPVEKIITEVATFRQDGVYLDGRHPDAVRYTLSAAEDVQRRDFTINGLLLNPFSPLCSLRGSGVLGEVPVDRALLRKAVEDHVGGLTDLRLGVVRAIGNPAARFAEDHLRMLRAVRFAARLGFELEAGTATAIRALAPRIAAVSRERVRDELTRMLTEGQARRAFELLAETDLLAEVLPEVARMRGVEQPPQYHPEGDVWQHTLGLLQQLEQGTAATLAWAALLHDVGKPATFHQAEDRIRFNNHAEVGVAIAADLAARFRFSNAETSQVLALVAHHMQFMEALHMRESTLKRFLRMDRFEEHLALHRMDCLASSGHLENWQFMHERMSAATVEQVRPKPLLTGHNLIAAGYRPGPVFAAMLRAAEDAQLEGRIASLEQALRLVGEQFGPATKRC